MFRINDIFMAFSFLCLFVQIVKIKHAYIKTFENIIPVMLERISFQAFLLSIWGGAVSECVCLLCAVEIQFLYHTAPEFLFNIISSTFSYLSGLP